jgi:hypothetical protein
VTDAPDLEHPVRIEVTPDEMEKIGKAAVAAVGLETEPSGEDDRRARFVVPLGKLANLATVAPLDQVLTNAEPVTPSKPQGQRRNHNTTKDGGPLVNWSDPENAGMPHNGRVAKKECEYVLANLEAVNERRVAAGHPPIDPTSPADAERYGFPAPEPPASDDAPSK